jgi:hypothetical protein
MMDECFEMSPRSAILSGDLNSVPSILDDVGCTVSLKNFIKEIPNAVNERQRHKIAAGSADDPIQKLFEYV